MKNALHGCTDNFINVISFTLLCIADCGHPLQPSNDETFMNDSVIVITLDDDILRPVMEGVNVTFACHPGWVLTDSSPTSSTCMKNGYWDPDSSGVECRGKKVIPKYAYVRKHTTHAKSRLVPYPCKLIKTIFFIYMSLKCFHTLGAAIRMSIHLVKDESILVHHLQ